MDRHPWAGRTVILRCAGKSGDLSGGLRKELHGKDFVVEDWWINVAGKSWMDCVGNPAAMKYGMRSGLCGLPLDDRVVYGKVGMFGHIVHESELASVVERNRQ